MRLRSFVFITLLTLCHLQLGGQTLTNALPPAQQSPPPQLPASTDLSAPGGPGADNPGAQLPASLPDDPGQEILPLAQPEPAPPTGAPVHFEAQR
jgi:hypothetical protein